jgi:hypothetical protein
MLDLDALEAIFSSMVEHSQWGRWRMMDADARVLADAAPALIAELRGLREATRWRPIAEAPKDGTPVELWAEGRRFANCYWMAVTRRWIDAGGRVSKPTHWRPLPDPPEGA